MNIDEMKNMSDAELAFLEGFVKTCMDKGIDPELLLSKAAADDGKQDDKKEDAVR